MDVILKYSQRNRVKNNVWATGVGGASFINGGTGTLYGINVGYDRFIKGVIVGVMPLMGIAGFMEISLNQALAMSIWAFIAERLSKEAN